MKNVKIDGVWVDVPSCPIELHSWLNEVVAYNGFNDIEIIEPGPPIFRWQTITHVRKNGRGAGIHVSKLNLSKKSNNI